MSDERRPGEPPNQQSGNPYLSPGGTPTGRQVINGYETVPSETPYYLVNPNARADAEMTGGSYASPSSLTFGVGEIQRPTYASVDEILSGLATLDAQNPEEYKLLEDKLRLTKFTSWDAFFDSASYSDMPWDEYLDYRVETDGGLYGTGSGGGGGGPTTQIYLSSESQAAQMLDQAFTQYLGRTASDEEVTTWTQLLNEAQRANPAVTTSSGGTVVTEGQFDPTRYAREYAQSQEGYMERYAAVNFMDSLDRLLSGGGNALDEFAENI